MKESDSVTSSQTFLILILVIFSLISEYILTVNIATGIDAFAKKNSKTSSSSSLSSSFTAPQPPITGSINNNVKVVIINFDDSHQSDYTYAKPILDKYGFKATFFEVCNWVDAGYHDNDVSATWEQIAALQQDGMDIESHTMTHPNLNYLS